MSKSTDKSGRPRNPSRGFAIEAARLAASGELGEAEELCRTGLIYYPDAPSGYSVLAEIYLKRGERERAEEILRVARARTGLETLSLKEDSSSPSDSSLEMVSTETGGERPNAPGVEQTPASPSDLPETDDRALERAAPESESSELRHMTIRSPGDLLPAERSGSSGEQRSEKQSMPSDYLSLHSGTEIGRIRSSNLRLIPGLEFAPLRRNDKSQKRFAELVREERREGAYQAESKRSVKADTPPSPLPELKQDLPKADRQTQPANPAPAESGRPEDRLADAQQPSSPSHGDVVREAKTVAPKQEQSRPLSPLEELARRLESARIPAPSGTPQPKKRSTAFEPSIVSDTFAEILVKQGALEEALKAYQILARTRPERREEYRERIAELKELRERGKTGEEEPEE